MTDHGESLIEAEQPTPTGECMAVRIACRCGQVYEVHVGDYPAKLSCHMCGGKGIVNRQGVVVYLPNTQEDTRAEEHAGHFSTAICEKSGHIASDAIQLPEQLNRHVMAVETAELDRRFERLSRPALPSGRSIFFRVLVFAWICLVISALVWGADYAWLAAAFLGVFIKPLLFFGNELLFGDEYE
jgi:hypothetical protein